MEYQALYRKYRPTNFDEVVEQKHITQSLINQIKNNQISHAYLFTGTRGTGKTSIARIFAKAINCEHFENGPCNKCNTCKILSDPSNMDIIEIDAASNNRVEEIRDLREKVKYPPVNGKYKVYIIDEVHMLTDSAFNALLKTLEEPPKYVVFILGTTEVQKLPATILSRCLRFDFKLVSNEGLEKHLKHIFDDSGIKYEDEAVSLIAKLGQGSVRDTLSIADMCVAYTNKNVTYNAVVEAVGITNNQVLNKLAENILKKNTKNLLNYINEIAKSGKNFSMVAKDLVGYFRDIAVVQTCDNYKDILKYPADVLAELEALAKLGDVNDVLTIMQSLGGLEQDFRYTQNPRALFEIVVLGLVTDTNRIAKLEAKVADLEKKINGTGEKNLNFNRAPEIVVEPKIKQYDEKQIWGKLLIALRNANEFKLYLTLESSKHSMEGNMLNISVASEHFDSILANEKTLKKYVESVDKTIIVNILKQDELKEFDVVEFLQNEFKEKFTLV